ncbi:MAG: tetratricopeptide repeat protein [Nitrososphaerota archaeon]|nr:tetratricopeptide repeat protein [Nitrososphaerota archaeon]
MTDDVAGSRRRLAAIMFSDVVGYTAMIQSNEKLALDVLEDHRRLLRPLFVKHMGREVKTIGDAFLIEFGSALDAVNCAIEMQQAIQKRNQDRTALTRIQIRIGIHVGDVVERGGDVYGDTVNVASRIEKLADSGGIAVSGQVYEQVRNKVNFPIAKKGDFQLKNVESPAPVYTVSAVWRGVLTPKSDGAKRVAVLPFRTIGGNQEDEYLADGLTEELVSSFSSVPGLKVIARTSAMRFKGSDKSVSEIGKELNAGNILEGTIRRSGERLRISVQLVETESEDILWAGKYDKRLEDALAIEEQIAEDATTALKSRLGEQHGPEARRNITNSGEAFLLYLKGRYRLARHGQSEVEAASKFFEEAIEKDPQFASAYAMLAQCHLFLGFFGFIPTKKAFEEAQPLLSRAIEIDADLDTAHMIMGRLLMDRDWDWSGAEAEFRRAIELSPNRAEAHYRYALLLHDMGRSDEAVAELEAADELDPLSVAVNAVAGTVLYYIGRNKEAKERFLRVIEIEPKATLAHTNLGLVYFEEGDLESSLRELQLALELDPNNYFYKADLCYVYSRAGMKKEAREVLSQAEADSGSKEVPLVPMAGMLASVAENDSAIDLLEQAYLQHSAYLTSLKVERWFDGLRTDARFMELLRKMRLA